MKPAAVPTWLLILVVVAGCHVDVSKQPTTQSTRASWRVPAGNADRGRVMAQACLTCHGVSPAVAGPLAPRLARQRASAIFFAIIDYRDGSRASQHMKPWVQGLNDQDARDLAAALAGRMLDRPPVAQVSHPGYSLAARECLWCHGETGIGELEGMPVLAGQDADYLAAALAAYRDGARRNPTMRSIAARLSDQQIASLAAYYSGHEWLERSR